MSTFPSMSAGRSFSDAIGEEHAHSDVAAARLLVDADKEAAGKIPSRNWRREVHSDGSQAPQT
jgi:hypothetical protein